MPTPDTSPKAVARVLREAEFEYSAMAATLTKPSATVLAAERAAECRALADALEQTPVSDKALLGALTWNDRLQKAVYEYDFAPDASPEDKMADALRAAFPELAPSDD